MIAYSMLGTDDLARARAFYDPLVAALGGNVMKQFTDDRHVWYGRKGTGFLVITLPHDGAPKGTGNGTMLAISADSHAKVREAHSLALSMGASNEGDPGYRTEPFFGSYFRDPDGHKLCVFSMKEA